jgi:quercetin dioxygenase-like cupin family protein
VTFENEQVRILKITYGPKEKSVMHEHPNAVAVFLTDGQVKFQLPDGKSQDATVKAGQSMFTPVVASICRRTSETSRSKLCLWR